MRALLLSCVRPRPRRACRQCLEKVRRSFVPTVVTGTAFWPVANVLNFMLVPAELRMAYVNLAGLAWNSFLSYMNATRAHIEPPAAAGAAAAGRPRSKR